MPSILSSNIPAELPTLLSPPSLAWSFVPVAWEESEEPEEVAIVLVPPTSKGGSPQMGIVVEFPEMSDGYTVTYCPEEVGYTVAMKVVSVWGLAKVTVPAWLELSPLGLVINVEDGAATFPAGDVVGVELKATEMGGPESLELIKTRQEEIAVVGTAVAPGESPTVTGTPAREEVTVPPPFLK